MCGVLLSNYASLSENLSSLKKRNYRGPDGTFLESFKGLYFGFNYLSITGSFKKSPQPYNFNGNKLLFNGEIYNYLILKNKYFPELDSDTCSDTQIISKMFSKYDFDECIQQFEGMWSIIYYNHKDEKIYISRDRLGIKPLFYYFRSKKFILSSDLKVITDIKKIKKINIKHAKNFLKTGKLNHNNNTFFKDIFCVPPGTNGVINLKKKKLIFNKFYQIKLKEKLSLSSIPNLKILLKRQIQKHFNLNHRIKIALPLSSGLDSNFFLYLLKNNKNLICYTLKNIETNENKIVKKIFESNYLKKKIRLKEVNCNEAKKLSFINSYISKLDQPIRSFQHVYQYLLRKKSKKDKVRVLFSGDGADEIFAGYNYCIPYYLNSINKFKNNQNKKVSLKKFLLKRLTKTHIPYWLHMDDINSMLNSIENRVPYLDYKVIEKVMSFKSYYLMKNNTKKFLMKEVVPKKILKLVNSDKMHKPGNSKIIYEKLGKDFEKNIFLKNFKPFFNKKKVYEAYLQDKKNKNLHNSDLWLRYYFFVKWINLNKIHI